ncbi:hypothetical protein DDZ16_16495 [Marinilabilia rubra]|uniref:Uncharacterized protein n=1 Tax=Marinilabilia rubra TaxID=2162893 RepID=A0A2U2B5C7_9BACT|nr:hypothetical protein DDZ16_16495 [Marinilabilia rubra]
MNVQLSCNKPATSVQRNVDSFEQAQKEDDKLFFLRLLKLSGFKSKRNVDFSRFYWNLLELVGDFPESLNNYWDFPDIFGLIHFLLFLLLG